jgi:hypothetical protein
MGLYYLPITNISYFFKDFRDLKNLFETFGVFSINSQNIHSDSATTQKEEHIILKVKFPETLRRTSLGLTLNTSEIDKR